MTEAVFDRHPVIDIDTRITAPLGEERGIGPALDMLPDNILFETDYPHPTGQAPGPASVGTRPQIYAERAMSGTSEGVVTKVMHETAAKLYGIA